MTHVDGHVRGGHTAILFFIFALGAAALGLSGFLTARFRAHHNAFSHQELVRVHYTLYAAAWTTFVSLFYLVGFRLRPTGSALTGVGSHLGFFFITWASWLVAAALLTHLFGGGLSCTSGLAEGVLYCKHLSTLQGIAWLEFIFLSFALIATFYRGLAASTRGEGFGGALVGGTRGDGYNEKRSSEAPAA